MKKNIPWVCSLSRMSCFTTWNFLWPKIEAWNSTKTSPNSFKNYLCVNCCSIGHCYAIVSLFEIFAGVFQLKVFTCLCFDVVDLFLAVTWREKRFRNFCWIVLLWSSPACLSIHVKVLQFLFHVSFVLKIEIKLAKRNQTLVVIYHQQYVTPT